MRPQARRPSPKPLLVATPQVLVYVDGNARKVAGAGTLARGFRILGAVADGSVVVSYYDANAATVEAIGRDLSPRAVKKFGVFPVAFIAPSNDGFLAYDGGLLRRYDLHGSLVGQPIAPVGARDALGFADAIVVIASGRLGIYDRSGRLRHEMIIAADRLVALPGDRFAVTDTRNSEVRVYTTDSSSSRRCASPTANCSRSPRAPTARSRSRTGTRRARTRMSRSMCSTTSTRSRRRACAPTSGHPSRSPSGPAESTWPTHPAAQGTTASSPPSAVTAARAS